MDTKLLSTSQAAEILGVDDSRVRQLILSGRLPSMQVGRAHLIKESDLALVAERKAGRPKKEGVANSSKVTDRVKSARKASATSIKRVVKK